MKRPKRDVPRAIVAMVTAVTLIYVLVIWAYIAIGPDNGDSGNALANAAGKVMGQVGAIAIVLAASVSSGANNFAAGIAMPRLRSEEHTSELQSLMRTSYAVFCLKKHTD